MAPAGHHLLRGETSTQAPPPKAGGIIGLGPIPCWACVLRVWLAGEP